MNIPKEMYAVVVKGVGGYDQLNYCKVPVPTPKKNEVLIKVLAAGVNNTEVNTRLGWYSTSVTKGTNKTDSLNDKDNREDGGWGKKTPFPFIQGTDCYGEVVLEGDGKEDLIGKRILVKPSMDTIWMGSDFDGAFAQYVAVPKKEVFIVESKLSDVELGAIPCAYGTAENMLVRSSLNKGEVVCITGASGGIGTAAIELAKIRGAYVIAITSKSKINQLEKSGADKILDRNTDILKLLGEKSIDVLVDNVAGDNFGSLIKLLKVNGRVVTSGAIAGPMVNIDLRDIYLRDITLIGCTAWEEESFPKLISYIDKDLIHPKISGVFPLEDIVKAQKELVKREHFGKFVLIPPQ